MSTCKFVVQEHHASHLHWDLRIELDGVLKSWAVPKGPPTEPGVKRLAIEVEDHPLDYLTFEGEIPEGQYGAGRVIRWDIGDCDILERGEGKLHVRFHGDRLQGEYTLTHTHGSQWLLFAKR